jgi:hypothetical protein
MCQFLFNLLKGSLVGVVPSESNTFLCEIPQWCSNYGVLWNSRHVFAKPKKLRTSLAFFGALTLTKLSILAGSVLVPFAVKIKP